MRKLVLAAALAALALPAVAAGQAEVARTLTCPLGGETFQYRIPALPPVAGVRPDGKPYGPAAYPPPLPECPGNGLVLYKDYDAAEVARLEPLIASEEYKALGRDHVERYRAWWLMKQMGVDPKLALNTLLQASWQADAKPELRARYLAEFAAESAKLASDPADAGWLSFEGRAINALRELGRFDEARARLAEVPLASLEAEVAGAAKAPAAAGNAARQAANRRAAVAYLRALGAVIERGDSSAEPLDLLPRRIALGRCIDGAASLAEAQRAFCTAETAAVDALRAARAKEKAELEALKKSREESGR